MSDQQPILAALLSAVFPGLGHAYLGAWGRSLLWLAGVTAAGTVAVLEAGVEPSAYESVGPFLQAIAVDVSPLAVVSIALLMSANVLDAFRVGELDGNAGAAQAGGDPAPDGDVRTCPACGKDVDGDLEFCHWCTEEFDE